MKFSSLRFLLYSMLFAAKGYANASPQHLPWGWNLVGKPDPDHLIKLTFAIKQHNAQWLKDKLKAVSYPDSPEYTNYMNFDEIAEHVYGKPESVQAVTETLQSIGAEKMDFTLGKDFIVAYVPYEKVEECFDADFYKFANSDLEGTTHTTIVSSYYSIPISLKEHIDFVAGISKLNGYTSPKTVVRPHRVQNSELQVTPSYIDKEYNISRYIASNTQNSQAVAAFLKQYFDASDLEKFQKKFNISLKPITKIVGTDIPKKPGVEANLDVQYISAIGQNVDTWFVSTSTYSNHNQEDFLSWIVGQVNTTNSPWVHSISYGDDESSIDKDYLQRVDNEFMKFGVSGRSVLFASGDQGVACNGAQMFTPNWPASSPYITSIGGTIDLETVWKSGGGGFSNVFPMPDYQKDAVEEYLNSGRAPSTSHFNKNGRAYPDISAFATNFLIIEFGLEVPVDGTSCSTPTVAGIISLLNDVRLNKGQKTLGFLNPLLYITLKGNGFFDIEYGDNGNGVCKGFDATKGWDPASGWGSPNFGLLKVLV